MSYLKFRCHIDCVQPQELLVFIESVAERCERLIVYRHPKEEAERDHIHGLCYNTTLSEKVFREWCNRKLKLEKSNKSYSVGSTFGKNVKISDLTYTQYITYMSKGKYDPLYNKGFADEDIVELKRQWKEPKAQTEIVYQVEKITPQKKLTQYEVGKEAEIRYMEIPGYDERDDVDWKHMIRLVIDVLHENRIVAHEFTVAHIVQDIQARLSPEQYVNRIYQKIKI